MPFCVPISGNWVDRCDISNFAGSSTFARPRHMISTGPILQKRVAVLINVDFDNRIPEEVVTVKSPSSVTSPQYRLSQPKFPTPFHATYYNSLLWSQHVSRVLIESTR